MAAMLPAIFPGGQDRITRSPTIQQHHIPTPPSKAHTGSTRIHMVVANKRSQGRKEKELEHRRLVLRAQQQDLAKGETMQYRYTYKHNLCIDMLQDGFHKSYSELFALIRQQNEEREIAGPESVLWSQVLLEDQPEKLDVLKTLLTQAESALRRDNYGEVYQCQFSLARYFHGTGDKWLADHFYDNCLLTTSSVKGDEGKMAAEAHCNVGLALEERGDYFDAADNFELFHKLCRDREEWLLEAGQIMHHEAATNLCRIYTTIASKYENQGDLQTALAYLEKANDMCWGSDDRKLQAESCYKVGVAYEKFNDSNTALKFLNKYLDMCSSSGDDDGYGKACEAIARSYDSLGKVEESIRYLEMFVEVAEKTKNDKATSRACSNLGAMFNSLGRYEQAVEYFNKSYNISRALNDTETISSSRVLFGVAAAHKMLTNVANHVELAARPCVERLIEWKDNRGDEFDKPLPVEEEPEESQSAEPAADPEPQPATPEEQPAAEVQQDAAPEGAEEGQEEGQE